MSPRRADVAGAVAGLALTVFGAGAAELGDGGAETRAASAASAASPPEAPSAVAAAVDELLAQLAIAPEPARDGFDRDKEFPHWSSVPGTDCDTRERVLVVEKKRGRRTADCLVTGGRWSSIYDGVEVSVPTRLDVDHMVALAEAWDSGAGGPGWDRDKRKRYANDLGFEDSLIAVTLTSNRSKGDQDPAEWKPPRTRVWCRYATAWTTVKVRWGLTADEEEVRALREMFDRCTRPPDTEVERAE